MPEPAKSSTRTNPWIRTQLREQYTFKPTEEVKNLKPSQKANQKIVLSFYGYKIDMPFKFFGDTEPINVNTFLADLKLEYEVIQSYKVEITHPLGMTHFRIDIPKGVTASQMNGDAIQLAELNVRSKREFEDYLIDRKQYDLEFSAMDLSHRQARLNRKYEYVAKAIDLTVGALSLGFSGWRAGAIAKNWLASPRENIKKSEYVPFTGPGLVPVDNPYYPTGQYVTKTIKGPRKPIGFKGQQMMALAGLGVYKGVGGVASGIAGLISASERQALEEEGFGIQIRQKALESYTIDLGFERQKEDQLFTMRRIFSNDTYNDVTNKQRQEALDKYESPTVSNIYLELWTVSELQQKYVEDYHDKFGVDCRKKIEKTKPTKILNEIRVGIYMFEDVIVEGLSDRIELEFLKARLTGGIKFEAWQEHPKVKELTPIDKRILDLQSELAVVRLEKQREEKQCKEQIDHLHLISDSLNKQLSTKTEQYHELSENFRKKEAELSEQTNLAVLYKNEADHFRQDLLKESQQHAQEKEGHSSTKEQLASKTQEVESLTSEKTTLTQQVDRQIVEIQEKGQEISTLKKQLAKCKPVNKLSTDYVIVNCTKGDNEYGRMLVVQYNKSTQAWTRTRHEVFYNPTSKEVKLIQAPVTSEKRQQEMALGFTKSMNSLSSYQEMSTMKLTSPLTNDSLQAGNGFPFFESNPNQKGTKLGCERWYKDGEWSHTEKAGWTKVVNYGHYLNALGLDLDGKKVVTLTELCNKKLKGTGLQPEVDRLKGELQKVKSQLDSKSQELNNKNQELEQSKESYQAKERELEETKNTLNGVREINRKLEEEIKEEIWRKKTYTQVMNYHPLKYTKSDKPLYPYVITGGLTKDDDQIYVCQFVEDRMCYVLQPNLKVKKYSSFAMLIITDPSNKKLLEWNYAFNNWHHYWGENITKWSALWTALLQSGNYFSNNCNLWTNNLPLRVLEPEKAFPCFSKTPTSKADLPIGGPFEYSIKEGWQGHHDASTKTFVQRKYARLVTNYGEYLEAMGLEAIEGPNKTIERIVAKKRISGVA